MLRGPVAERVSACFDRIASSGRPDLWIELVDRHVALAAAAKVDRRTASGHHLPLKGTLVAVQDNIDVAGLPTTSGCKSLATVPSRSAPAVAALVDAGAVIIGKTTLDQLATGLLGTWSPDGPVRNAFDARYISGGACSGGAVAVALGLVDVAVTTDIDGAARVPAACNGVVAVKPTRGLISLCGVHTTSPSVDTIAALSRHVAAAWQAVSSMAVADPADPHQRSAPQVVLPSLSRLHVGIPDVSKLPLRRDAIHLYEEAIARLVRLCAGVELVDISPFTGAGSMLLAESLSAERYATTAPATVACNGDLQPEVVTLVHQGENVPAHQLFADLDRLRRYRLDMARTFAKVDVIVLPTIPYTPTIDEALDNPLPTNAMLGTYTTGANPLDLCGIAVPAGISADGLPFGITIYAAAFHDPQVAELAAAYLSEDAGAGLTPDASRRLVMIGRDPNSETFRRRLADRGGRLIEQTTTSPLYREVSLDRTPGRVLKAVRGEGNVIGVEVWALSDIGFADVVAGLRPPLAIGGVKLEDGRWLPGLMALTH
jgi:allophanate hydrolase